MSEEKVTSEIVESTAKTITFVKPFVFEGETFNSISLDFENLTGDDIEKAEHQFVAENPSVAAQTPLKEMSKGFLAIIAAKAAKKSVTFIRKLPAPDYSKVTTTTMAFLMKGE